MKQWVVWRYEPRSDGKYGKVPVNALTGANASVINPTDWFDFETVVNAYEIRKDSGLLHGIGLVFCSAMSSHAGIDIDDAHGDEGQLRAHRRIVAAFTPHAYIEASPSGTGLHIIVRGRIEGKRRLGVEAYSTERFFTFTGHVLSNKPMTESEECQRLLDGLQADLSPNQTVQVLLSSEPQTADDDTIIARMFAAKNGAKAENLFNGIVLTLDSSPAGRIDESSLDLALCNCIVWHSKNVEQVERIWLRSRPGQRDKVQRRPAYRMATIRKAFDRHAAELETSRGVDIGAVIARARAEAERAKGQAHVR